jgi:hypothetical protein
MTSQPKLHHQVPRFYLARFTSDGRVTVRRRDGLTFDANPVRVAAEVGFYDVPDGAGGKSTEVEGMLASVEGATHAAMGAIDRSGVAPSAGSDDRATLALFLALQMTRTTEHRERVLFPRRVLDWAQGREVTRDLVADYLEQVHLGFKPRDPEVEGAFIYVDQAMQAPESLTPEFAIEMMLASIGELVPRLVALNWTIETDRRREFITSDMPALVWRKPTDLDNFQGLGIDSADELRFPLDAGKQLVLSRRKRPAVLEVAVHRVRRANADLAAACHRFVVASPDNRAQIDTQPLDEWRPVIRFNVGPLVVEGPDGQLQKQPGDVLHMWVPRRAGVGRPRAASRRVLGYRVDEPSAPNGLRSEG